MHPHPRSVQCSVERVGVRGARGVWVITHADTAGWVGEEEGVYSMGRVLEGEIHGCLALTRPGMAADAQNGLMDGQRRRSHVIVKYMYRLAL